MPATTTRPVLSKLAARDAERTAAEEAEQKRLAEVAKNNPTIDQNAITDQEKLIEQENAEKAEMLRIEKEKTQNDNLEAPNSFKTTETVSHVGGAQVGDQVRDGQYQVQILKEQANLEVQKQILANTDLEKEKELTRQKALDVEAMKLKLELIQAEKIASLGYNVPGANESLKNVNETEPRQSSSFFINDDRKTTISTKREFQGIVNNKDFRRALTENSVATLDATKEWFAGTARLPKDLHSLGGQAWKVWYNALTSLSEKAKNMVDVYRESEILPQIILFADVLDSCIQDSRSDRELDGVLQFVSGWGEHTKYQKLFGTDVCERLVKTLKISRSQSKKMHDVSAATLRTWKTASEMRSVKPRFQDNYRNSDKFNRGGRGGGRGGYGNRGGNGGARGGFGNRGGNGGRGGFFLK